MSVAHKNAYGSKTIARGLMRLERRVCNRPDYWAAVRGAFRKVVRDVQANLAEHRPHMVRSERSIDLAARQARRYQPVMRFWPEIAGRWRVARQ